MSNQQWNSGQGNEWAPKPQSSSGEWPQQQGQEWNQGAQDWGQQQGQAAQDWTQPQGSAQEWNQQQGSAQEWGQAQPQASAQEWGNQQAQVAAGNEWQSQGATEAAPQQDWNQHAAQGQQDWNQQQQWQQQPGQGQYYPAGQHQGLPQSKTGGSPFDFGVKQLSLPGSAGMIFLMGTIGIAVWYLFQLISVFGTLGGAYGRPVTSILGSLLGSLGMALFAIMVLRVLVEIGVATARILEATKKDDDTPSA